MIHKTGVHPDQQLQLLVPACTASVLLQDWAAFVSSSSSVEAALTVAPDGPEFTQ